MARPMKNQPPEAMAGSLFHCAKCNEDLPASAFYWKADGGGIQATVCRACWRGYHAKRGGYQHQRTITCEWCGEAKPTAYARAAFCSRACKDNARKAAAKAERLAAKAALPPRTCPTCGGALTPRHRSDAVFCSDACSFRAHNVSKKIRKRIGATGPRPRKDPLVSLASLAKRDGYRCGICGGTVAMTRRHPDPLGPSIDHIIPLARGGTNDLANLQLSHFRCNWRKNAGDGQHLRLAPETTALQAPPETTTPPRPRPARSNNDG